MSVGVICCKVLEKEMRSIVQDVPAVTHIEVMEWGLHARPDLLLGKIRHCILDLQDHVDAIMLGYGRCQALDRLQNDFRVPVFYPDADDCIGVLLGQERYRTELMTEAGTWFLTPGWAEMGMDVFTHDLSMSRLFKKGIDPLQLARRMLKNYTRALFIDMKLGKGDDLAKRAGEVATELDLRLDTTEGSLALLTETFERTLNAQT